MTLLVEGAVVVRDDAVRLGPLDLSLEVAGITCVMGHNGAGKSLFLRLIHGLIPPDRGSVRWDGVNAAQSRASRGFIFQTPKILRRSVAQNVAFPLVAAGVPASGRSSMVDAALTQARLQDKADQPAATLSGGEQQRMALARALVARPAVVLMDEPTASMDPSSTTLFEDIAKSVVASGTALIMSTHDREQAQRLADRILEFENGVLLADETSQRAR